MSSFWKKNNAVGGVLAMGCGTADLVSGIMGTELEICFFLNYLLRVYPGVVDILFFSGNWGSHNS